MYQFNIEKIPMKYCHLVKSDQVYNYDTNDIRNALKCNFNQSFARTDLGKRALSFIGPKIWRILPSELKICSFSTFKNNLKNNLLKTS